MPTCLKENAKVNARLNADGRLQSDQGNCVAWAGSEHLVACYRDSFVGVLKATGGEGVCGYVKARHLNACCCAGLAPSAHARPTVLAAGGLHNTVEVWAIGGDAMPSSTFIGSPRTAELRGHLGYVSTLAFVTLGDGDGSGGGGGHQLLSGSGDGTCRLWDVGTGQTVLGLIGHGADVSGLKVPSGCGGRLAVTSSLDCTVRVWDLRSGSCVRLFRMPDDVTSGTGGSGTGGRPHPCVSSIGFSRQQQREVEAVDVTRDGSLVAAAMRFGWATFDVRGYGLLGSAGTHSPMTSIALVGDGRACLGGSETGTLRVIDTYRPEVRHEPEFECTAGALSAWSWPEADPVTTLASCPDGSARFASVSLRSSVVRTWGWTHDPKARKPATQTTAAESLVACKVCCCVGALSFYKQRRGVKGCCCCFEVACCSG